jgi:SAM-dependent methyltransferase
MTDEPAVADHYTHGALIDAIRAALAAAGRSPDRLTVADLAPIDEFHMGGRPATLALAKQLGLGPGDHLLDVGCGIGGPARCLAEALGCRVTGIDLTEEYVAAAAVLSGWVGLADRVAFRQGSALALPFDDGAFDGATMIHVGMNVADKAALFAEVARVLRPGGVFGVYDVMRAGDEDVHYPVPWASSAETSFLDTREGYRAALDAAGFAVVAESDRSGFARDVFAALKAKVAKTGGPPPLGLHVIMGAEAPAKTTNMIANVEAGRIAPVELIARRR